MRSHALSADATAIQTRDLHVVRAGATILNGLDCVIRRGSCVGILGPNGCGKTTFTRVLTGQAFITRGQARVLGQPVGRTDIRALRRRIGLVAPGADNAASHDPGATVDADLSAHEAVLTGFFATVGLYDRPSPSQRARADELLAQVGLAHRRSLRFASLSSGEQRRCLMARALVHLPELLILDEPTAALDVAGREQVLGTIERIMNLPDPPTVVMITHHVEELSPRTTQVLLMKDGRFIADGPPERVITPESLTALFGCRVYVRRLHGRFWLEVLPEAWLELTRARGDRPRP